MTPSCVMRRLPFRVYDRSLSDLHNAVTWDKANCRCRLDKINVGPLETMVVNVIGDFAEEDAL
jgi:hypothetical protein